MQPYPNLAGLISTLVGGGSSKYLLKGCLEGPLNLSILSVQTLIGDPFAKKVMDMLQEYLWFKEAAILALIVIGTVIFYRVSSSLIRLAVLKVKGREGDVKMLLGLWRIVVISVAALAALNLMFNLGIMLAVLSAFGGMVIGWSLQRPITGLAAWIIITLRRPFKVGDRIQLPAQGLTGDVVDIGPMYTTLNQVGGAIGSEESVGRHILIPNAMLFDSLIINYTPKSRQDMHQLNDEKSDSYILDEVVTRVTFDSKLEVVNNILLKAAREVTHEIIECTGQEPYIRCEMWDYGVIVRLRYMTKAVDRPRIAHEITKRIVKAFSEEDSVDFAIPYLYSYKTARSRPQRPYIQVATR
ncbi:MAG: mechanosensitive ion channel family protein [Candidatus Bathyarchaeia archaeon]